MRVFKYRFLLLIALLTVISVVKCEKRSNIESESRELGEKERAEIVEQLKKTHLGGDYILPRSKVKLHVGEEFSFFHDEFARNIGIANQYYSDDLEGVLFDNVSKNIIYFFNLDIGYIPLDAWKNIDLNKLKNTMENMINLRALENLSQKGGRIIRWIKKPTLYKDKDLILFEVEVEYTEGGFGIERMAIKLGRTGCEAISITQNKDAYEEFGSRFDKILHAFNFDIGSCYKDYKAGDKIAKYNIAQLLCVIWKDKREEGNRKKLEVMKQRVKNKELDVNGFNKSGRTHLASACRDNNVEMVRFIIEKGGTQVINEPDVNGDTPLLYACGNQNISMIKFLVEHGAKTSINKANYSGIAPLLVSVLKENSQMFKLLIENGAKDIINKPNKEGVTILSNACFQNSLKMVTLLIDYGAKESVNIPSHNGITPLSIACERENFEMVKLLLKNGAKESINVQCKDDSTTSLFWACKANNIEMVRLLLENGANKSINKAVGESEITPLLWACDYNNTEMVKLLLAYGAKESVNKPCKTNGRMPLLWACGQNNLEMAKLLLEHGAKESINNQCEEDNMTPLLWACQNNNTDLVKLLLAYGAEKTNNKLCKSGSNTPIILAYAHNNEELIRLLVEDEDKDYQNLQNSLFSRIYNYVRSFFV